MTLADTRADHAAAVFLDGDDEPADRLEAARRDPQTFARVGALLNSTAVPLRDRFRALFTLRNLRGPLAVQEIARCFNDPSALLRHELAYVLGQIQHVDAVPALSRVLETTSEDPMVRHEAAEALGAIALDESLELLEKYRNDPMKEVAETCEIAIDRIKYEQRRRRGEPLDDTKAEPNPYLSVDPAPPSASAPTSKLRAQLLDAALPLFERYRAMFALRNRGDEAAVLALADGLQDSSALFRHEIAYVLGQMAHKAAVPALAVNLRKGDEHPMVRHECAEALGSIATPEVFPILEEFSRDPVVVVKESCEVALDMYEYENSGKLEYADGLQRI